MIQVFYNFVIWTYSVAAQVVALFDQKAKQWVNGRNHWKSICAEKNDTFLIWFHCASLGEFEQARPVIEEIRDRKQDARVLLTFFSPSGFNPQKQYEFADYVTYLPLDLPRSINPFLDHFQPAVAVFIKYELWFNLFYELHRRSIPTAIICAHFPDDHFIFNQYTDWFRNRLGNVTQIQTQNESTKNKFNSVGIENVIVAGDTRHERVLQISRQPFRDERIERFTSGHQVLVVGSFWTTDRIIAEALDKRPNLRVIVAPHQVSDENMQWWQSRFPSEISLWTSLRVKENQEKRILYMDTMGLLSKVYRYGHVAYVGGGFGSGVHNTLEPAVYNIPVIFGPKNKRFQEVQDLKELGIGLEVFSSSEFELALDQSLSTQRQEFVREKAMAYFDKSTGATASAADWIEKQLIQIEV